MNHFTDERHSNERKMFNMIPYLAEVRAC